MGKRTLKGNSGQYFDQEDLAVINFADNILSGRISRISVALKKVWWSSWMVASMLIKYSETSEGLAF